MSKQKGKTCTKKTFTKMWIANEEIKEKEKERQSKDAWKKVDSVSELMKCHKK